MVRSIVLFLSVTFVFWVFYFRARSSVRNDRAGTRARAVASSEEMQIQWGGGFLAKGMCRSLRVYIVPRASSELGISFGGIWVRSGGETSGSAVGLGLCMMVGISPVKQKHSLSANRDILS